MRLSHVVPVRSAVFDEPNLVSHAGLVPVMGLTSRAALIELADRHVTVPGGPGHAAGLRVSAMVGGMVAGADSISDMALLRHGALAFLRGSTLSVGHAYSQVHQTPAKGVDRVKQVDHLSTNDSQRPAPLTWGFAQSQCRNWPCWGFKSPLDTCSPGQTPRSSTLPVNVLTGSRVMVRSNTRCRSANDAAHRLFTYSGLRP